MIKKITRARKFPHTPGTPRPNKRPIGYRPLASAPFQALINVALVPIGRLPGGRAVVFTEGE